MDPNVTESLVAAFFWVGRAIIDTILPFFSLFRDETVAPAIAVFMVMVAAALGLWLAISITWLNVQIHRRIKFVKGWSREEFSKKFGEFDDMMKDSKLLRHSWEEYKETLLPQKQGATIIESTVRPGDFINLTELEHSGLKLKWFHNIPGIFVGFGLLFTFIGLVAALYFAAQAIHAVGGQNVDAAQQTVKMQAALAQLLGAATFKFWTSIAGLISSIALGMVYRFLVRSLDRSLDTLCRQIERCTLTVTPEMLSHRQFEELQEQTGQLKNFNTELAFTLGQALEGALAKIMPNVMSAAMSPVAEKLDSLTQNMVREFGSVISENAGAEIREMSKALMSVKDSLLETSQHVAGSGSGLSDQITEAAGDLRAAAQAITEGLGQALTRLQDMTATATGSMATETNMVVAAMREAAEQMARAVAEITSQIRSGSEDGVAGLTERLIKAAEAMQDASHHNAERIGQAVERIIAAGSQAEAGVDQATAQMAQTMERQGAQAAAKLASGADQALAAFKGSVEDLANGIEALWERLNKLTIAMGVVESRIGLHAQALEGVSRVTRETETSLSATARSMAEAGRPLSQATQALRESIDGSARATEATAQALSETQRRSEALSREMTGTLSELQTVWNRHSSRFDKADENLGDAFIKITDYFDGNVTNLERYVKEIDSSLSKAVNLFAGNIAELGEIAQEFQEVAQYLDREKTAAHRAVG